MAKPEGYGIGWDEMGMSRASVAGETPLVGPRKRKERKGKQASLMKYGLLTESDSEGGVDARSGEIAASGNREGGTNGFLETRGSLPIFSSLIYFLSLPTIYISKPQKSCKTFSSLQFKSKFFLYI